MGMFGLVFLAVVVLLLVYAIGLYNRLVRLRALVKEGFSGITVQLRRRADLVPNLVEAVKGYASHEREVFEEVSKARAASVNAGTVGATAQALTIATPSTADTAALPCTVAAYEIELLIACRAMPGRIEPVRA